MVDLCGSEYNRSLSHLNMRWAELTNDWSTLDSRSVRNIGFKKKIWMVKMIFDEGRVRLNHRQFGLNHRQQKRRQRSLKIHLQQRSLFGGRQSIPLLLPPRRLSTGRRHNHKSYQYKNNYPDCYDDVTSPTPLWPSFRSFLGHLSFVFLLCAYVEFTITSLR